MSEQEGAERTEVRKKNLCWLGCLLFQQIRALIFNKLQ